MISNSNDLRSCTAQSPHDPYASATAYGLTQAGLEILSPTGLVSAVVPEGHTVALYKVNPTEAEPGDRDENAVTTFVGTLSEEDFRARFDFVE